MFKGGKRTDLINAFNDIIANASSKDDVKYYLSKFKPNKHEIDHIIKDNRGRRPFTKGIMDVFIEYLENILGENEKEKCFLCGKRVLPSNVHKVPLSFKDDGFNKVYDRPACPSCHKKIQGNKTKYRYCTYHSAYFDGSVAKVKCPLFPDKCHPKRCCPNPHCLELHCRKAHSRYHQRKWTPAKKYIGGKVGEIIISPLPVGIEFEVVGKDDNATRKNIFKLDKNIGIGSEQSIAQYLNPTEIQTPPSSLAKLENLTHKVCESVLDDGMVINNRCGIHIHIDTAKTYGNITKNPDLYRSLLLGYIIFEDIFDYTVPSTRHNNPNVKNLRHHRNYLHSNWQEYPKRKFGYYWYTSNNEHTLQMNRLDERGGGTKYLWVNFHSLFRKQGLEIRSMEASLSPQTILKWISFNQKFIEGIASLEKPLYKIRKIKKLLTYSNSVGEVQGLFNLSGTPFLPPLARTKFKLFKHILLRGSKDTKDYNQTKEFIKERISKYESTYDSQRDHYQSGGVIPDTRQQNQGNTREPRLRVIISRLRSKLQEIGEEISEITRSTAPYIGDRVGRLIERKRTLEKIKEAYGSLQPLEMPLIHNLVEVIFENYSIIRDSGIRDNQDSALINAFPDILDEIDPSIYASLENILDPEDIGLLCLMIVDFGHPEEQDDQPTQGDTANEWIRPNWVRTNDNVVDIPMPSDIFGDSSTTYDN